MSSYSIPISALEHSTSSAIWPVPYVCAQPYHPAVAAMDSCFLIIKTHQHGIAPDERSHLRLSTPLFTAEASGRTLLRVYVCAGAEIADQQSANTLLM